MMTRGYDRRTRRGPLVLALLIASLWLKLLVPAGYMLTPSAAGIPLLTPCDGVAAPVAQHAMPMGGKHHQEHPAGHAHESPCPYAALSAAAAPPQPPLVPPAVLPIEPEPPSIALATPTVRGLSAPPPPSTGPPLIA